MRFTRRGVRTTIAARKPTSAADVPSERSDSHERVPRRRPVAHATPVLSIVIPLLNEEEVLEETYRQLKKHLDALGESYELIFVDDGSTDRSRAILAGLSMNDPAVRVV